MRILWVDRFVSPHRVSVYTEDPAFVDERHGYTQRSLYRTELEQLAQLNSSVESIQLSNPGRKFQALAGLCASSQLGLPENPRVLTIGYREDTFDSQALVQIGLKPSVVHLDISPPPESEILGTELFSSFEVMTADANDLAELFEPDSFDVIYFSRSCLDIFPWKQAESILTAALTVAKFGVVAHLQSIYWSPDVENGVHDHGTWFVVDYANSPELGDSFPSAIRRHVYQYAVKSESKRVKAALRNSVSDQQLIHEMSLLRSPDTGRIRRLEDLPGTARLGGLQFDGNPFGGKLYLSSIVYWAK